MSCQPTGTPPANPADPISIAFATGLGPWLFPLRGKLPIYEAWQDRPPITEADAREFVEIGYNLGLRTGSRSGVFVIDDDQAKHPDDPRTFEPPPTGFVIDSPTGSAHHYYRFVDGVRNSANTIAPHVDVRGEGGYVVYAGSVHPVAKRPYRIRAAGEFAECEAGVLAKVLKPSAPATVRVDMTRPSAPAPTGYVETALAREVHAVRTAAEGARNDTLNKAAFSLGQLVAGGALTSERVTAELTSAATLAGLPEREIAATIRSGMSSGAQSPRKAPERPATATATKSAPASPSRLGVLVPGSHVLRDDGAPKGTRYVEQGNHVFIEDVLSGIPAGTLYRRADSVGEIVNGEFRIASPDRIRSIVDRFVTLQAGKANKDEEEPPVLLFRTCSRDHAGLLIAGGQVAGPDHIRELKHLAAHPICVGADFAPAPPGWHAESNTYRADDAEPEEMDLPTAKSVIEDLICDFPFATKADRANYLGLLLTPILRPALGAPVPMHLIGSPMERSGKTKLVEIVLGCTVLGQTIGAAQLAGDENEHDKRILAILRSGQTILHLDNLKDALDSAPLASLLTSHVYQGRVLATTTMPSVPNGLTVVGTGNNVHATGEIAKRIVPIMLQPGTDTPEERDDFRHPDILRYAMESRLRSLGACMAIIEAWRDAGRPLAATRLGGFERWSQVVGGIMGVAGYDEWLSNRAGWRGEVDDFGSELAELVAAWHAKWACEWVQASEVFDLAVTELGLFDFVSSAKTTDGARRSFGRWVMNRAIGRALKGGFRIENSGRGARRRARLTRIEQ